MAESSEYEQWQEKAQESLLKPGIKNVMARNQQFEKCVAEATLSVNERLNLQTLHLPKYYAPVQDREQCKIFLQWINKIKIPKPKLLTKEIRSFADMKTQIHQRYNYLKPERFGDVLFPSLIQSAIEYAALLSDKLFNQQEKQKKQAYESILIKFYWLSALGGAIDMFHQTKLTPLICARSIKGKGRELNRLLKSIISEQQLNRIIEKKNLPPTPYNQFPRDSRIAIHVLQELAYEELNAYKKAFIRKNQNVYEDFESDIESTQNHNNNNIVNVQSCVRDDNIANDYIQNDNNQTYTKNKNVRKMRNKEEIEDKIEDVNENEIPYNDNIEYNNNYQNCVNDDLNNCMNNYKNNNSCLFDSKCYQHYINRNHYAPTRSNVMCSSCNYRFNPMHVKEFTEVMNEFGNYTTLFNNLCAEIYEFNNTMSNIYSDRNFSTRSLTPYNQQDMSAVSSSIQLNNTASYSFDGNIF